MRIHAAVLRRHPQMLLGASVWSDVVRGLGSLDISDNTGHSKIPHL